MDRTSPAREYNKAVTQLIIIAFFSVFGGIVAAFSLHGYNELGFDRTLSIAMFGFGAVPVAVCGIVIYPVLQALRIGRGGGGAPTGGNDASNRLLYSEQHITTGRLEDHTEPNSIGLGRIDLSKNEWRKLAGVLAAANWRWSRRLLDDTNIWEGLTAMHGNRTKYEIVTSDFEKMQAVKVTRGRDGKITKARVTPAGREAICQLADGPLL